MPTPEKIRTAEPYLVFDIGSLDMIITGLPPDAQVLQRYKQIGVEAL